MSQIGGGGQTKMSEIWTFENPFKMLVQGVFRHQYVLKFKNVRNLSERGVQHFSNKSEIKKKSEISNGGASLFGTLSEIFPFFNYEGSPYMVASCPPER